MISTTFVKTCQIYHSNCKTKHSQSNPKQRACYDHQNQQVNEPKNYSNQVDNPKTIIIDNIDLNIRICRLKNPFLFITVFVQLNPPPEATQFISENVFCEPEIDRYQDCDKNKIKKLAV